MRAKVQNKKKPIIVNHKGPIRLWVPKSQIVFVAGMFQGRRKVAVMVPGQWLLTTYDRRKAYIPNPNSEGGRNCGIWRKLERKCHWYGYYW